MLVAVAYAAFVVRKIDRVVPVHLLAAFVRELVAEVSGHGHAVPRTELGPEYLVEMGGEAVARPAHNLMHACDGEHSSCKAMYCLDHAG